MVSNLPQVPDYIDEQDYEYILARYLGNVRDDVDKREGSIIWDSGAPLCIELAIAYLYIQAMILNCFAATAPSPYLELRCEEQGITRRMATPAKRLGTFTDGQNNPYPINIGTQFSTVDERTLINYTVTEVYTEEGQTVPGSYILTCDEVGTIGNQYFGEIIPVYNLAGLATATLSDVLIPGEDDEDIEELRAKYFDMVNKKAFGGNITQYREFIENINGVSICQIYPHYPEGGQVRISILDSQYNKPSTTLIETVQQEVDPHYNDEYAGLGLGTAPIGHVVTVVGPIEVTCDIEATIETVGNMTVQQVKPKVEESINNYFLELRKQWASADDLNRYSLKVLIAGVRNAIFNTEGVSNLTACTINDATDDIVLTQTGAVQQIPVVGEIEIDE